MNENQPIYGDDFYKTEVVALLRTSLKTFDRLGILPSRVVANQHRRRGKAYIYTAMQLKEAARRLGRMDVYNRIPDRQPHAPVLAGASAPCPPPASQPAAENDTESLWDELF